MLKKTFFLLFSVQIVFFNCVKAQQPYQLTTPFLEEKTPSKPDYSSLKNWAAHPDTKDMADLIPKNANGITDNQSTAKADVFFIYPTIYTKKPTDEYLWNAAVDDQTLNQSIEKSTILNQATIFNGSCKIYAPRYRQAHYTVFTTTDKAAAKQVMDIAYEDIKAAFEYYLKNYNSNRPIVIAGHSQGTIHAKRLLKEFFDGKELQKKLVEAYLVGIGTSPTEFVNIKPSYEAEHFGGFVSWNTYIKDFYPEYYKNGMDKALSINPLNWTATDVWEPKERNSGSVGRKFDMFYKAVDATNNKGILWINKPYIKGRMFLKIKIWHAADYNLFWMNTRENVALRLEKYLITNP
jgi:Protein of unknown function (DUF3089)